MARYILTPFGGVGDINPFIWLARLLSERDHVVKVLGAPMFSKTVSAAGLEFTSVGCDGDYSGFLQNPDLGDPAKAARLALQFGARTLRGYYDAICMALLTEPAVLIAPVHHLAARAVKEKYCVPLVVVHTQPSRKEGMGSAHAGREDWLLAPSLGMGWLKCMHSGCMTAAIAPALRKFCDELGIKVPRQRLRKWSHPPDLEIMLYPEWFSGSPEGSPPNSVFDGFPLEDLSGQFVMPGDLRAFIGSGEKPVLLTLESHGGWSQSFFEAGLRACALLGVRALFATNRPELLPDPLPPWVHVMEYHPFSEVLPRVRAAVHDGGIGTLSQCLAAGVPQLITPTLRAGQDNAAWLRWHGAGESLIPAQFSVESVASSLLRLTSSTSVKAACESLQALCRRKAAGPIALEALEGIARERWTGSAAGSGVNLADPRPNLRMPS